MELKRCCTIATANHLLVLIVPFMELKRLLLFHFFNSNKMS